jgi:gluconokinase
MSPGEYLFQRLFGEPVCSVSMASGTGLFEQERMDWDDEVLAAVGVRREQLSPLAEGHEPRAGLVGEWAQRLPVWRDVPWFPALGDGACSNVGCGCVTPDRVALMVGTSGAMRVLRRNCELRIANCELQIPAGPGSMGVSEQEKPLIPHPSSLIPHPSSLIPPWGIWRYCVDRHRFLFGGALSNGGNLLAWLYDTLRLGPPEEVERELAAMEPDVHGLTILPFLAGERSPGWATNAVGSVVGLRWHTRPIDIFRAGLEAVACRFALLHELLGLVLPEEHQLFATGGALLRSPAWLQIMADALGRPVVVTEELEASGRGAALLALEALGALPDLASVPVALGPTYHPNPARHARYRAAVARQRELYETLVVRDP